MLVRAYSRRFGSHPVKFDGKRFVVSSELTASQAEHGQLLKTALDGFLDSQRCSETE